MVSSRAVVAAVLVLSAPSVDAQPGISEPRRRPTVAGGIGLTFTPYAPDPGNESAVGSLAVGFDAQTVVWLRPAIGVRGAFGVEFLKGPVGTNGHPAGGSFGLASIALALRRPLSDQRPSFGVDLGVSTTFESTYSYSYTSDGTTYVYPSIDLPLNAGPFVEPSLRGGKLIGWLASYRHYLNSSNATEGRLKRRFLVSFFVGR